jgi:hypothetical protein
MPYGGRGYRVPAMGARPRLRHRGLAAVLLIAALALAGCGSQQLAPIDRARLSSQLSEVRDAAGRGDRSAARQALDEFVGEVRRLRRAGGLDGATAGALLLGAQRARARLEVELAPPPPPQPVSPAPQTPPGPAATEPAKKPKPQGPKHEKKQEKKDKGGSDHDQGHKDGKKH